MISMLTGGQIWAPIRVSFARLLTGETLHKVLWFLQGPVQHGSDFLPPGQRAGLSVAMAPPDWLQVHAGLAVHSARHTFFRRVPV